MRCKVVRGFSPHGGLYGLKPRTTLRSRRATALCRAARRECEKCGIGGAEDVLARCGVEHQFAEPLVEGFRQPSRRPFFDGESPVNERRALVACSLQARQMALMGAGVSRSRRRKDAG